MRTMPLLEAGRQGRRLTTAHASGHAQLARFIVAQMPVAATPVAFSATIFVRMPGRLKGDPAATARATPGRSWPYRFRYRCSRRTIWRAALTPRASRQARGRIDHDAHLAEASAGITWALGGPPNGPNQHLDVAGSLVARCHCLRLGKRRVVRAGVRHFVSHKNLGVTNAPTAASLCIW